ncbi:hypothetical protein BTUL_0218g00020 [Botrytis tulipae]|uniref:Uncharacterized protein n=1 Tax=Botrytis tulipae TaxID=87230 RepID=A0A4Z1E817_9HELO|nr:hypothetical protein BTUL_0218g00020 [Botrytis tulipae]
MPQTIPKTVRRWKEQVEREHIRGLTLFHIDNPPPSTTVTTSESQNEKIYLSSRNYKKKNPSNPIKTKSRENKIPLSGSTFRYDDQLFLRTVYKSRATALKDVKEIMLESGYMTLNSWQESLDRLELEEELNGECLKLEQPTSKTPLPKPPALIKNLLSARRQTRNGKPSTTEYTPEIPATPRVSKTSSVESPSYMSPTKSSSRKQTPVPGSESRPTKTSRSTSIAGKASSSTATKAFTPPLESISKTPHFNRNPVSNKFHAYTDYMTGVSSPSSPRLKTLRGEITDNLGPYTLTFLNSISVFPREESRLCTRVKYKAKSKDEVSSSINDDEQIELRNERGHHDETHVTAMACGFFSILHLNLDRDHTKFRSWDHNDIRVYPMLPERLSYQFGNGDWKYTAKVDAFVPSARRAEYVYEAADEKGTTDMEGIADDKRTPVEQNDKSENASKAKDKAERVEVEKEEEKKKKRKEKLSSNSRSLYCAEFKFDNKPAIVEFQESAEMAAQIHQLWFGCGEKFYESSQSEHQSILLPSNVLLIRTFPRDGGNQVWFDEEEKKEEEKEEEEEEEEDWGANNNNDDDDDDDSDYVDDYNDDEEDEEEEDSDEKEMLILRKLGPFHIRKKHDIFAISALETAIILRDWELNQS